MEKFSDLFARVTVGASSLAQSTLAVLVNVTALLVGDDPEQVNGAPLLGALGLLARPKAPDGDGKGAKGLAARTSDGMLPFALVDVRISKARGELPDGAISLAGYLGQHVTLEDGAAGGAKLTLKAGALTLVLDTSPSVSKTVITGETRVTGTAGGEAAAQPVLIAPAAATITALVTAVNQVAALLNAPGPVAGAPGAVTAVVPPTVLTSPALRATPT